LDGVPKGEKQIANASKPSLSSPNRFPAAAAMARKRKTDAAPRLDEADRTLYSTFCGAANSLSQLYTQAMAQQKLSFQAGERHAFVRTGCALPPFHLL
jgi:hypothetical protein